MGLSHLRVSLIAQLVRNLPVMQETFIQFLGREDLLEKGKATHSSILAWRIPWSDTTEQLSLSLYFITLKDKGGKTIFSRVLGFPFLS